MALAPIFKKAYWSLAALGGLWLLFISSLLHPPLQRHALYAHKVHPGRWQDLDRPEKWGFLKNQIQPFNITTSDGESLYAWHILPIAAYAKHEHGLLQGQIRPLDLLTKPTQKESLLAINFHGNAGTVAQGWRTDTYRALSSGASDRIHVIGFDYRGFGRSTGSPTELGLIEDGIAVVQWALDVAKIPPDRIVVVGQSLGTAVATAVAEHFAESRQIQFSGLALIAGFSDLPTLLTSYSIGGVVPILSPLKSYPIAQKFFTRRIVDTWFTSKRLAGLVRSSSYLRLTIIHAKDDFNIHWTHSDTLFYEAVNATSESGMTRLQVDNIKTRTDLGASGWMNSWVAATRDKGIRTIKQVLLKHGGHNRVMTYPTVTKAILELFEGID